MIASGRTIAETCSALHVSKQTLHRWRASQTIAVRGEAGQLHELRDENVRLRRIVADQALRIQSLQDELKQKRQANRAPEARERGK
jgi:hypothetical protein